MYDSRSNHGRRSKDGYDRNAEERFVKGYGIQVKGRPLSPERLPSPSEALEEAVALRFDLSAPAMTFHRECTEWWEEPAEPMADWERELLDEVPVVHEMYTSQHEVEIDDEPDFYADDAWLPCMSYAEVVAEMGDGFIIEGPVRTPVRTDTYVRVWELADTIGANVKDIIGVLRLEYGQTAIRHHFQNVAMPIAEAIMRDTTLLLVLPLRTRPTRAQDPVDLLRMRLLNDRV